MIKNLKILHVCVFAISLLNISRSHGQSFQAAPATNGSALVPSTMPAIFPTPVSTEIGRGNFKLGTSITLIFSGTVDKGTRSLVSKVLENAGVKSIKQAKKLPKTIDGNYMLIGTHTAPLVLNDLKKITATLDTNANGYTLASKLIDKGSVITLTAKDAAGLYYAVQTFRQLANRSIFPEIVINDHPALPIRGTIEGFYGKPWSMEERERH